MQQLFHHGAAIYGTGRVARDTVSALRRRGIAIRCAFDHMDNPSRAIDEVDVVQASSRSFRDEAESGTVLVVAIFNRHVDIAKIVNYALSVGWIHVYTFVDIFEELSPELGERYWLSPRSTLTVANESISRCSNLFGDSESRSLFQRIVDFRRTGDYRILPAPTPDDQYRPRGLPRWNEPLRLVDAGAYDGDTILAFLKDGYALTHVAAFEPGPKNFGQLQAAARSIAGVQTSLHQCGLWSESANLSFDTEGGESCAITEHGLATIHCERLDDVALNFFPSLIKLDIEGAELNALMGAVETIRRNRPALAVCLYHKADHLWEIPLWLSTELHDYQFSLRLHGFSGFELVLYLYPTEQYTYSSTHT